MNKKTAIRALLNCARMDDSTKTALAEQSGVLATLSRFPARQRQMDNV